MTEQPKLLKPRWSKIQDLERQRSGYNVLVKVVKAQRETIQTATGLKIPIVRAVVADETGSSNAFFKGDKNTEHITEGKVIAIRNGVKKFIKGHISLEIDDFGLITLEKNAIEPSKELNISQKQHQFKPRYDRNNRGKPRFGNRRNQQSRGERRDYTQNRNRRDNENRRYNNSERRVERTNGRDQDFDRRPRRDQPSRNEQDRPRRDYNRNQQDRPRRSQPRNQEDRPRRAQPRNQQDRQPRRRQEDRQRKPRLKFSKIQQIEPGDENITFIAKVLSVQNVGKMKRCLLGDQTAVVKAFLPSSQHLEKNNSVIIFDAESKVVKEHIEIQVLNERKIDIAKRPIEGKINEEVNISEKSWVETD